MTSREASSSFLFLFFLPFPPPLPHLTSRYITDRNNHVVRKISGNGFITTYAGIAGSTGAWQALATAEGAISK